MSEDSYVLESMHAEVPKEESKDILEYPLQVDNSENEESKILEFHDDSPHKELDKLTQITFKNPLVITSYPSMKNLMPGVGDKLETSRRQRESMDKSSLSTEEKGELRYLKYGDKVCLRISGNSKYYLSSDGFATERVYFRRSLGNDSSQTFRVVPKVECASLDALRRNFKSLMNPNDKNLQSDKHTDYASDIMSELEVNKKTYSRLIGEPVRYYAAVQLIHEETQQYVSISKNTVLSDNEINSKYEETELKVLLKSGITKDIMRVYSLKLVPCPSASTHFTLIPCHKYQESGNVLEEDFFYFAYADSKLLNKHFYLYFPLASSHSNRETLYIAYLYDTIKTPMKYESISDDCTDHLCRALSGKLVWITHIESPHLLCLEKLEKSTEQYENELASLIESAMGEVVSQTFALDFKTYDPTQPMTANGLWIVIPKVESKNEMTLKHLLYDVWLKPLVIENLVRRENQNGILRDGSVIRLINQNDRRYVSLEVARRGEDSESIEYKRCFKIVKVKEEDHLKYVCLAQLSKFIRAYDEEILTKSYNFTKSAGLFILSRVLRNLKRLCKNTLVSVYSPHLRYGVPNTETQDLFREAKCIDTFKDLLLKLFPAGASEEYKTKQVAAKLLGQLLMLVAITVKNNTKNQVYTFNKAMGTIQKYIGLHLPKKQEDQALLSVVENCEEILLDLSLDQIINQFVKELAVNDFEEQMKKYEILDVLRIFCVFHEKAVNETQYLLHNILFETEKGSKIFLPFKFKDDTKELIVKIYADEEISCIEEWPNLELKKNVLSYFRNQLFLLSDISYKNPTVLHSIKDMFPIPAVLENLKMEALDPIAKLGLAKMLISLFENTENLMFVAKPKLQQEWGVFNRGRKSKFMSAVELDQLKDIIKSFFTQNLETEDTKLHCEYLRFLTYFIRCDFIFSQAELNREWERGFKSEYELVYRAFYFCCTYLTSVYKEDKLRSLLCNVDEGEFDNAPKVTKTEAKSLNSANDAPLYLRSSMNYLHIFENMHDTGKKSERNKNSSDEDSLKREVCNFFCEINLLLQDVSLYYLKCMIKRVYEEDPNNLPSVAVKYVRQLFGKKATKEEHIEELNNYFNYKSLLQLYNDYVKESNNEVENGDGLMYLLIGQLISSKSIEADTAILNAIVGYLLPRTEFSGYLSSLLIIAHPQIIEKHRVLSELMMEMVNCLYQLASWPEVRDTNVLEQLKQSTAHLTKWKEILSKVYDLFEESLEGERKGTFQRINKKDERFTNLFMEKKTHALILTFLKISAKIKIEVSSNILGGNNQPGLHAVTFSWELLKAIEVTNKTLSLFCRNSLRAKQKMLKHISKVIIIPLPSTGDKDDKQKEYADITRSDMELINEITSENINIAYLNNQEVRYFKDLVNALNKTVCQYNIDKVFMIYKVRLILK